MFCFVEKIMHLLDNHDHQNVTEFKFKYEEGLLIRLYSLSLFLRLSIFEGPWEFKFTLKEELTIRALVTKSEKHHAGIFFFKLF